MNTTRIIRAFLLLLMPLLTSVITFAADESYVKTIIGKISKGDSCTVVDDKFVNLPLAEWNDIRHVSVTNSIVFELRKDTNIYYHNRSFTCTLTVAVKYFSSRDQLRPTETDNIKLIVRYDTTTGKFYKVYDTYEFKNAYKVTVVVKSIESPEWGDKLPAIFRIRNQINVQRVYPFSREVKAHLQIGNPEEEKTQKGAVMQRVSTSTLSGMDQISITWEPLDFPGSTEYDVEWTFVDKLSEQGQVILTDPSSVTEAMLEEWMRFDNTRVTVYEMPYAINLPFAEGYLLVRVRGVAYNFVTGLRETTNWQYNTDENDDLVFQSVDFHEEELNWQYVATYAEEGKRKEVISYFDAVMRNRQMVTINNRDQIAIAAETVYDNMGRPALSIMPAPVLDQSTVGGSAPKYASKLQFYPAVNKNTSGDIYSYADISAGDDCDLVAAPLNTVDGASNYYSPQNPYLGADPSYTDYYFTKYLPNGEGYTFSQTQYIDDNTGRIRRQGGVGKTLQIGNGHDSRYYYGKPLQSELYRLFGMEVGDASHYLKNMVVDPNGQVSISYLNASGKVIATALGGTPPAHMDALPSESVPESKETITQRLIGPGDFINNTGSLIKQSTATFLASVTGTYTLQYSIKPTALGPWNTTGEQNFCSNCYYDVLVTVKDDCGETVASATTQPFLINNTECPEDEEPVNQNLSIPVERLGEYTVTYQLRLSEDVVAYQTEYYIQNNTDLLTLQHFFNNELILADLSSCYSECTSCMEKLGTLSDFTSKMTALLLKIKEEKYPDATGFDINHADIATWITSTYNTLLAKCEDLVEECESASPCEQKLELMKNDVRPGGQYFIYNEVDFSIPAAENNVSILFMKNGSALNYKSDPALPNLSFKDENGVVRGIKDVGTTTEMFIKAYLQHPEWADEFVKRHIEYCSYLWCQSNSSTYAFDQRLRDMIKTGDQAQTAGYFNGTSYLNILDLDPFFNGTGAGVSHKAAMQWDMINMSDVLRITFPNASGVMMAPKSIQGVVEWMLYCKPTSLSATATDWVNSWSCATPSSSCRSLTSEWEMFRHYYLQLKSKYVRLAKQEDLPECENCFIGQNQQAVTSCDPPGELTDYSLTGTSGQIRVVYESGTLPFKSNYRIKVLNTATSTVSYLFVQKGATQSTIIPGLTSTGNGQIQEIVCISPQSLPGCAGGSGGTGYCEYVLGDFVIQERNCQYIWSGSVSGWMYDECEVYVVYTGGTVTTDVGVRVKETLNEYNPSSTITESYIDVVIPAGQSEVYVGQSIYSISRPSWPNHFIEARTYGTSDYICYPPPFDCPEVDDFDWEQGGESCTGLLDVSPIRVFYTGSALNLPFPANKKITITVSITLNNSSTISANIVLSRNGQGGYCVAGRGISATNVVVTNVLCEDITVIPPPSSDCTNDPRAPYYATKVRIYDEYVDYESGLDCQLNGVTLPTSQTELDNMIAASIAEARLRAIAELADLKQLWLDQLRGVVAEENDNDVANSVTPRFSSLADPSPGVVNSTIQSLVNNLELVAKKYIEIAPSENIRPASTLPLGQVASNGYSSFEEVFDALISSTMIEDGFGPHLLSAPYPHDRTPVLANPNVRELSTGICTRLGNLKTRWTSAGSPGTFHSFLQTELGSDYGLTADELADLESRCTNGCKLLKETLILPTVFAAPAPGDGSYPAWITCTTVTNAYSDFDGFYPNVEAGSKLYRVLLENYMNSRFGFSLGFDDYDEFKTVACPADGNAVLYNKVRNGTLQYNHEMQCTEDILRLVFDKAAQEYEYYIEEERKVFRNNYISACLSATAGASLTSERYEYHYTLYYYDQSDNLVKTVPPEGVSFLTEEEIGQIEEMQSYMQYGDAPNPANCVNETMPATEDIPAALTAFSDAVEDDEAKAVEMWIYAASPGDNRQVRFTTPDNKYLYQAAIKDGKVWVELYSMVPAGSGSVSIVQTTKAVANLPYAYALQNWTNIVVQSGTSLADGNLQLIVDGKFLTNLTGAAAWPYPFSWSVDASGGTVVYPENDLAVLRHMRMYNRVIDAEEAKYNYQNICLSPWGSLSTPIGEDGPLISWTRFNIPQPGDPGTITPSASSYSLQVFQDEETMYSSTLVSTVSNNFTVEFWAKPQSAITLHTPGFTGSPGIYAGMVGQRYAISPAHGIVSTVAGMGISVGTNGVQVAEHSNSYLPIVLSWEGSIYDWTHIAVVYNDRTPSLYINGVLVSTGIQSQKATVHPSANIQGNPLGVMDGLLDEIRVWNTVRSVGEIAEAMNLAPETGATGLAVYWPLENTSMIEDVVGSYDIPLWSTFYEWHEEGAPVSTRTVAEYNDRFIVPNHRLPTFYAYNSLNKVVSQTSPDGGTTEFWYDRLGRLVASQNSEQKDPTGNDEAERYSYTKYDELGRITEVGERYDHETSTIPDGRLTEDIARTPGELQTWLDNNINRQVVQTAYDIQPLWAPVVLNGLQRNLRKRVAASRLLEDGENLSAASYYNYDISGNVTDLYQQNAAQQAAEAGFVTGSTGLKHIKYDFDLVSGKVNRVGYEDGKWDQFYQKYGYDAENRLISVGSTRHDAPHTPAVSEATYRYYMHGPLARMELGGGSMGNNQVQGLDYAYTLQGWIKGVNGKRLDPATAMAEDGVYNGRFGLVARDVFAYSLGYFRNTTAGFEDYLPIGSSAPAFALRYNQPAGDPLLSKETGLSLYNGNISHSTYAMSEIESGATAGYTYRYDQLNRLKAVRRHTIGNGSTWDNTGIIQAYREDFSYDANGNIKTLRRNGADQIDNPLEMDELTYNYNRDANGQLVNNRLRHVNEVVDPENYTLSITGVVDLENQVTDNYSYDKIGNLVSDQAEGISEVKWNVQGKIASISKTSGQTITYGYDPDGNRISKTVSGAGATETTYYVRDAQGNVLAVYKHTDGENAVYTWAEQPLYGSSRIGMLKPDFDIESTSPLASDAYVPLDDPLENSVVGLRVYELTNHLGNVMVTISDRAEGHDDGNGGIDYYIAEVLSQQDYYAFGMQMPYRHFTHGNDVYRYGFNGKENDNDVKGEGNQQDYGMRIYDPRVGRFLSEDPLTQEYPWYTPYQFAGNTPIQAVDLDGSEEYHYLRFKDGEGKTVLALLETKDIISKVPDYYVSGRTVASPTIAGGYYSTGGYWVYKEVKNQKQEYYVWQNDRMINSSDVLGTPDVWEYDEKVKFNTYQEALNSTDKDFENTAEDNKMLVSQAAYNSAQEILDQSFQQDGRKLNRIAKALKSTQTQFHHLISRGLKNTNAFVQKAILGGFKIDGIGNLTPLERFLSKYNTGVHAKHPKYTKQIDEYLNGLEINKFTPEKAKEFLEKINKHILKRIKENPSTKINDLGLDLKEFKP